MTASRGVSAALLIVLVACLSIALAPDVSAQSVSCGEYLGLVCEGLFTDEPDVTDDPASITASIERVTANHGNPLAVVIASDTRGQDPVDFAVNLANDWGVGDPVEENGILVLVAIAERRTEVVTQPGIDLPGTAISNSARSFFSAGDFDGGINAIIGAIDVTLSGGSVSPEDGGSGAFGWIMMFAFAVPGVLILIGARRVAARRSQETKRQARSRTIDAALAELEPRGDEVDLIRPFRIDLGAPTGASTAEALDALARIDTHRADQVGASVISDLSDEGAVSVLDVEAMHASTRVPFDLRSSGERPILEDGLEVAVDRARTVPLDDEATFSVTMDELQSIIRTLRPHRVAAARRRAADTLATKLAPTLAGHAHLEEFGSLLLKSAPVLDQSHPFASSAALVRDAHRIADEKLERLVAIRKNLAVSDTRDIAAVALADASGNPDDATREFTAVLDTLEERGTALEGDNLSLPAIAALLVINNSASDIPGFLAAYDRLRKSHEPHLALEGALAGLFTSAELSAAKASADELGLPVSVAVALSRRRDDGAAVYTRLAQQVSGTAEGEDARVIAGVLAVSLEPAVAFERWTEARTALAALGLSGSYADVAAAFGASDPRGPRAFAVAYAAQRSALEEAGYSSLTRYAPELAHAGTSNKRDTWTDRPLTWHPTDFDPFTFFYLHWAATGGRHTSSGWDGLYRSPSWADGGSSWWGGGGHFGGSGGSSWGSGGSSWSGSSGGFSGGFGGGGGFSGGGGGGW